MNFLCALGVYCFSSCRLSIGPSTSAWVFLWGGIRRFEYLEQTLQCYPRLSAAHDQTMTVVSSSEKCLLVLCALSQMVACLMWYFLYSKICFEISLIVLEAICGRCASFTVLTTTVSEIFGGQTNPSILVSLV